MIGLTWGGVQFPWSSAHILVPLVLGIVGLIAFLIYEAYVPEEPIVRLCDPCTQRPLIYGNKDTVQSAGNAHVSQRLSPDIYGVHCCCSLNL